MTMQLIKKTLWVFSSSLILALLLLPTSSFAQRGKTNSKATKAANQRTTSTRTTAKRNNTVKRDYTTRKATRTTPSRRTAKRTTRATKISRTTPSRRTAKRATRATKVSKTTPRRSTSARATTNTTSNRRAARRNNTVTKRATSRATSTAVATRPTKATTASRYNNDRKQKTRTRTTTTDYVYDRNQQNDYCNNYYRNQTTWNRSFWTSINYTPSYYDLWYNRFPYSNNLRAQKFRFFGERYWLYDGIWFQKRFGRYYAIDAPIGLCLDFLPTAGELIWYRGEKYVIYRGTAYQMLPFGGFEIVPMLRRF